MNDRIHHGSVGPALAHRVQPSLPPLVELGERLLFATFQRIVYDLVRYPGKGIYPIDSLPDLPRKELGREIVARTIRLSYHTAHIEAPTQKRGIGDRSVVIRNFLSRGYQASTSPGDNRRIRKD